MSALHSRSVPHGMGRSATSAPGACHAMERMNMHSRIQQPAPGRAFIAWRGTHAGMLPSPLKDSPPRHPASATATTQGQKQGAPTVAPTGRRRQPRPAAARLAAGTGWPAHAALCQPIRSSRALVRQACRAASCIVAINSERVCVTTSWACVTASPDLQCGGFAELRHSEGLKLSAADKSAAVLAFSFSSWLWTIRAVFSGRSIRASISPNNSAKIASRTVLPACHF